MRLPVPLYHYDSKESCYIIYELPALLFYRCKIRTETNGFMLINKYTKHDQLATVNDSFVIKTAVQRYNSSIQGSHSSSEHSVCGVYSSRKDLHKNKQIYNLLVQEVLPQGIGGKVVHCLLNIFSYVWSSCIVLVSECNKRLLISALFPFLFFMVP